MVIDMNKALKIFIVTIYCTPDNSDLIKINSVDLP